MGEETELEVVAGDADDELVVFWRIGLSSAKDGARGSDLRLAARETRKSDQASDWLVRGRS